MAKREKTVQTAIAKYMRERGAYVVVTTCPPCATGTPDILACYEGIMLGVEVKRDATERASKIQEHRGREIVAAGGVWTVAWSVDQVAGWMDYIDSGGRQ